MNTGELIKALFDQREAIREIDRTRKELVSKKAEIEAELMIGLDEVGLTSAKGEGVTVSISEAIVPIVNDSDAFYEFILKSKQPYLLERRPAVLAYRELISAGEEIPGIEPYTKRTVNMRAYK